MKRAALYVRVSTSEQKLFGISIDSQIKALQDYCKEHNYDVVDVYNDAGHSAHASYKSRRELLRMLADISSHKIDIVLFCRLDRWFRSLSEYYKVQEVLEQNNVPWRAIWEEYETETSSGQFKVNIMLSVAQAEADMDSERIKSVKAYARERGRWNGGPAPVGYKLVDSQLVKDPEQEWVAYFFETYLKTFSRRDAIDAVNKKYGVRIPQTTQYKLLNKPVYYGMASGYHKCEPYITKEQYDMIQVHKNKHPRKTKVADYIFVGMTWCPVCNARMRGTSHITGGKRYKYYSCNGAVHGIIHGNISLSEKKIEKYMLSNMEKLIAEHNEIIATADPEKKVSQDKQRKKLEQKLERVKVLYEEGDISTSEYKRKRDTIKQQLADLKLDQEKKPVVFEADWMSGYMMLNESNKRKVWSAIIDKIIIEKGKEPTIIFL